MRSGICGGTGIATQSIYLRGVLIKDCVVQHNNAIGVEAYPAGDVAAWIVSSTIQDNPAGAYINQSVIKDSLIADNISINGVVPGIYAENHSQVLNNDILDNHATVYPEATGLRVRGAVVTGNVIRGNLSDRATAEALWASGYFNDIT
ncbi:MAG: right-handed parallel beta-helix repeat-containing protein [Anaerolineales bacterium]|nr:right-handed parallel beta-helix repeat-containing protein [Anaerolineales bacterium]